ncbi:MAG TPA: hypothetical protein VHX65_00935 [Pirellulales bacterium]|nr:hypothetical protein [Pirellulales bacterium]
MAAAVPAAITVAMVPTAAITSTAVTSTAVSTATFVSAAFMACSLGIAEPRDGALFASRAVFAVRCCALGSRLHTASERFGGRRSGMRRAMRNGIGLWNNRPRNWSRRTSNRRLRLVLGRNLDSQ